MISASGVNTMMSIRFVPRACSGPGPAPVTASVPPRRRASPLAARGRRAATRSRRALLAAEGRWGAGERRNQSVAAPLEEVAAVVERPDEN